jgi:hypothetical protein
MNNINIEEMKSAIKTLQKMSKQEGQNIIHNYKWREIIQKDIMLKNGITVKDVSGITGDDFLGEDIKKGDYKSTKGKLLKNGYVSTSTGKFEFDKQNDEVKRKKTMDYDCLFFTWFIETEPKASVLIKGNQAVQGFQQKAKKKLDSFVKLMEKKEKEGKRVPRDSITFNYNDAIAISGARYFSGTTEITLKEFKAIFGE